MISVEQNEVASEPSLENKIAAESPLEKESAVAISPASEGTTELDCSDADGRVVD